MNDAAFLQSIDALHALLSGTSDVGIVIGSNPSLDSMAAALSFYLSLSAAQKNTQIVSFQDPIVEHSNLVGVDKIKRSFSGRSNTIVLSVPFREGEVEKVSYSTEGDRMNFSIIGGENGIQPFDLSDIQISAQGAAPSVLIAIGVSAEGQLLQLEGGAQAKIVNIDINSQNPGYGDVQFVSPSFSSLSEIVAVVLQELALPLDIDISQNLFDGVASATQNFTNPSTSAYAFEAASILMRHGARRVTVREREQVSRPVSAGNQSQQLPSNRPQPVQQTNSRPQYNSAAVENKETKPLSDEDFGEPQDIPSDWFVPKVFKGSKKPGQQ